jgi:pimeloyl-ACP methyl ester carboxylesterase
VSPDVIDLLPLLRQRVGVVTADHLANKHATVLFTSTGRTTWTVELAHGKTVARYGRPSRPDVVVHAELPVLADVVAGRRGGIAAFLAGDLTVRGNLTVALELDGLFPPPVTPRRHIFARPSEPAPHDVRTRTGMVTVEGVQTFYVEAGPRNAPPIVLVHGLGTTNASMLPLLDTLGHDFRVLAPDLPGHGGSGPASGGYAAALFGKWLHSFLEATCDRPAVLIGNSLGGRTAIQTALDHPDSVQAVVLLCPAVAYRRLRQFVPVVRLVRDGMTTTIKMPVPRAMVARGIRALFANPAEVPKAWIDAAVDEFLRMWDQPTCRYAMFSSLRHLYLDAPFDATSKDGDVSAGFWDRLARLSQPALFIWGAKDIMVSPGFARHVQEALPSAQSVVLQNCGHIPQFEQRVTTDGLISAFLASVPVATARRAPVRQH